MMMDDERSDDEALEDISRFMIKTIPHYTLDGHTPVQATDWFAFLEWYAQAERHVAHDFGETWELSTVFLAVAAHRPQQAEALPLLFETCLFRQGAGGHVLQRYQTWEEAAAGHAYFLAGLPPAGALSPLPALRHGRNGRRHGPR